MKNNNNLHAENNFVGERQNPVVPAQEINHLRVSAQSDHLSALLVRQSHWILPTGNQETITYRAMPAENDKY